MTVTSQAPPGREVRQPITPPDEARELFEVNVLGTVWAIQAAWPIFAMQRSGHFVSVSSAAAKHGTPGTTLYSATKAAQMNLAEGLRIEAEILGKPPATTPDVPAAGGRFASRPDPIDSRVPMAQRPVPAVVSPAYPPAGYVLPSLILGVGILLSALVFGLFIHRSRAQRDTIQVTGAATQAFTSDVIKWRIVLSRQVATGALPEGYAQIDGDLKGLLRRLDAAGVPAESVSVQPVNALPSFDNFGERVGFNLQQSVIVVSNDVARLEGLALNPGELIAEGLVLESSQLEYFYSGIDSLKHSLLGLATADARERAEEIASGSEMTIAGIVSARSGVFQITEPYSTEVADYGIHNTASKAKEITVTVHATFQVD